MSRPDCVKLREAFDHKEAKSLEAALKSACSGEPNFMKACLTLISGDLSQCPLGSDKEPDEDEHDMAVAGARARTAAESHFNRQQVVERGEKLRKDGNINEEDELPSFDYENSGARSNDIVTLSQALKDAETVREELDRFKETIKDEILATRETWLAIHSHCYETETWIGTLRSQVSNLRLFDVRRGDPLESTSGAPGGSLSKTGRSSSASKRKV